MPDLNQQEARGESRSGAAALARANGAQPSDVEQAARPQEIGGPADPEPTRYGDWQRAGRCIDF